MSVDARENDLQTTLSQLEQAQSDGQITAAACENIRRWLSESRYQTYVAQICEHIASGKWQALDDAFWTIIPFGTGGRRGRMYPIGSNAINDRTIGESAQGLADYVKANRDDTGELSCAIAYDTRHKSIHFSRLCASIMVAAGFKVYLLDTHRSTPELSFLVRHRQCSCGIMVTASHNPPSDNAVKVYWSTGGQICPPHDKGVVDAVMNVGEIHQADFDEAVANGQIVLGTDDTDVAFIAAVKNQQFSGPRDLRVVYSPLHGVGGTCVMPALEADGFTDVELFPPHAEPNGDFPNVPGNVSNPENPAVFDAMIEHAKKTEADICIATDPDCDRIGCAAPLTSNLQGDWGTFTGNQIGALLADYVLEQRRASLTPDHYLVKTLVTTDMIRRIGDSYGVQTHGNLPVGFKWIGSLMDQLGPDKFVFGCEESHGYLVGQYARDKDGAVASMLLAELAATLKAQRQTLHEKLDALYWQHGYHAEQLRNQMMEGSAGMDKMRALMKKFREAPPETVGGIGVTQVRDYLSNQTIASDGSTEPLAGPTGDMVILDLAAEGNYIAVRPSGTEPKVKFYMFAFTPAEQLADLETTKTETAERLAAIEKDLAAFAESV